MGVFTRRRKLDFKQTLLFIARGVKTSLQRELDSFFKEVNEKDFNIREVTKGALTQARQKLRAEAFSELNDVLNKSFYEEAPYNLWNGFRVLSTDGTRLVLPRHPSVVNEFGQHGFGPNGDSTRSMALASCLYDTLNLMVLDSRIAPYASSERDLLDLHLEKTREGDLLLLDRGYPSKGLFVKLATQNIDFCVRMPSDSWTSVRDFLASGNQNGLVEFEATDKNAQNPTDTEGSNGRTAKCRLVAVTLPTGEKEVLCTSLLDEERYPAEHFAELYHLRWNEEEAFKLLKARMEIEYFSGKTALAVKQDFHAKIFIMSLCSCLSFPIEEKVRQEHRCEQNRKHNQKINRTNALSNTRELFISFFIRNLIDEPLLAFDKIVMNTREIIRPNRKVPRPKRTKQLYNMNYKRL